MNLDHPLRPSAAPSRGRHQRTACSRIRGVHLAAPSAWSNEMKQHLPLTAAALAVAVALWACNRPEEPAKPITGSAENAQRGNVPDPSASGTLRSSGATSTSPEAPTRTATGEAASPGSIIEKNPTAAGMPPAQLSAADKSFLKDAAEAGAFEVEVARLAADHASDSAVKAYAAMVVDQRSATNDKLRQLAATGGLQLPPGVQLDAAPGRQLAPLVLRRAIRRAHV